MMSIVHLLSSLSYLSFWSWNVYVSFTITIKYTFQYVDYKQEGRLVAITNKTGMLLHELSDLVSRTAKKAEEAFYLTPPDPNVT